MQWLQPPDHGLVWLRHMNLLWRDDFGSFLDASAPDASGSSTSFANTVGPDIGFPSQPLLWTGIDPAPSAGADVNTISLGGVDAGTAGLPSIGSGLTGQDMLWAEPRSSAASWQLADNAGDTGATAFGACRLAPAAYPAMSARWCGKRRSSGWKR